jgi:hypothetical protein
MKIERLLASHLAGLAVLGLPVLAAGCGNGGGPLGECATVSEGISDDWDGKARGEGRMQVADGEACPDVADVTSLTGWTCCPSLTFEKGCSFTERREDVQDTGWFDTGTSPEVHDVCVYEAVFTVDGACCGRPLLRDGQPMTARVVELIGSPSQTPGALPELVREAAAAYWLRAALLEHASVASFARFSLELMRYGAPADLLAQSHQAGLDEIEHARLCFALASRYAGTQLGPDELPLGGSIELSTSLADFAEAVALEGCIGETLAAIDAAARLKGTTDPAVATALRVIIDDESRHAMLAWRTIRWLLSRDTDGTVRARLDEVFAAVPEPPTGIRRCDPTARAHGLLTADEEQAVARDAWERVILPAWA